MASGLQAQVFAYLQQMERAGLISDIRHEQIIQLTPTVKHRIDFIVFDCKRGIDIGIEAKWDNKKDGRWSTIKQLYKDLAPTAIQIWTKARGGRVGISEEIAPGKYKCIARE